MVPRLFVVLGVALSLIAAESKPNAPKANDSSSPTFYDFNLPDIDGKMTSFAAFKGKVVMVVNVASESNFTPQYTALDAIYEKYKADGFTVAAFPANDFGNQEPNNEAKIKAFSQQTYRVTFPMFAKVATRGDEITPLFHYLTKEADPKITGDVHWNFTKFLLNRNGKLVARFDSDVEPDDPDVIIAIEKALHEKEGDETNPRTRPSPSPDRARKRPTRDRE